MPSSKEWERIKANPATLARTYKQRSQYVQSRKLRDPAFKKKIYRNQVLSRMKKKFGVVPTRPMPDRCECCGRLPMGQPSLALDHCHSTGVFRGWICMNCNQGIGKLGDNLDGVLRAARYLSDIGKQGEEIKQQGNDAV